MNEVEKMYENAGILCLHPSGFCKHIGATCEICERHKYPPFTAEKQIELIKWLIKYDELHADFNDNEYGFSSLNYSGNYKKDFAEALASVINFELWQGLTEEEQNEIKNILKG